MPSTRSNKITQRLPELLSCTATDKILSIASVQELWSGYGEIQRIVLEQYGPVIVKFIEWPNTFDHPRGWASNISHDRKVKSYNIEVNFYQDFSPCAQNCRIPQYLGAQATPNGIVLALEDLDNQGFPIRRTSVNKHEIKACLSWLANFHASFLGAVPIKLWETGTYWHLATRPDELEALSDTTLKNAAPLLDQALKDSPQTIVHGDAKLANFCFGENGNTVSAVDFQYTGAGCGMKDLAYFVGSCLDESACEQNEKWILDFYFIELRSALNKTQAKNKDEMDHIENSWRDLYPVAWADFHRFLKGWSPGHWKINSYSERMCRKAIELVE